MKYVILFSTLILFVILVTSYDSVFAEPMGSHHDNDSTGQHGMMMNDSMVGTRHMSYKGMCAPGFASLGKMCVLDDRCGPGAYAGKVCMMDGVMKQYLRPLHQKHAGLSVDNIICAEGKQVMFKHYNAAPACINLESVEKLKHRGWQMEKPAIACTMEYAPVCGINEKTYGNMCALNADHIVMKNKGECKKTMRDTAGIFDNILQYSSMPLAVLEEKGYGVIEIASGVYWLAGSGYQTMFLTTGEGVVVIDAPKPIGEKYLEAIAEVTDEPITHMIYSHHHQDHTGAAGQVFPEDITYIAHKEAVDLLVSDNDPNRPIPTTILEGNFNTLEIGNKVIEFHNIGDFHSKGNLLIMLPQYKIGMLVDLFRPAESPYRAFGATPDIELYLDTHDVLKTFDFDVLLTGHTNLLATKDHITINKEFTQSIMDNAQEVLDSGDSDPTDACVTNSLQQWEGKLGNLDAFMVDHCTVMIEYLKSK